jgi:hypothetical protein
MNHELAKEMLFKRFNKQIKEVVLHFNNQLNYIVLDNDICVKIDTWNDKFIIEAFEEEQGLTIWSSSCHINELDSFDPAQEKREFFLTEGWEL